MAKTITSQNFEEEVLKSEKPVTPFHSNISRPGQPGADLACVRAQSWKHWQKKVIM